MALQDYANRKYDYLAFRGVAAEGDAKLGLALYSEDTSGQIATGIQKLAQRWALEFLTEKGSMPGNPERGADFMTLVRQGRLRTQVDVISAFNTANLFITRNLRNEEYADMPDDERFTTAEILSVAILPGYVNLRVMIASRAGDERAVILPISTLP
jgi:hypothetical protein